VGLSITSCHAATGSWLLDFEQIVPGLGFERPKAPVVEDQELDTAELGQEAGIASVAARQREAGEQLGRALIEDRSVVAAGLVAERAGQP